MCGIFMAQGDQAGQDVLAGLKRLEYRGYDSWGVAVLAGARLAVEKRVGKIGSVEGVELAAGQVALGHTRWATHGGVTQVNAHPHLASDGSFALVQNGVVENYQELKQHLQATGYTFISQTDTEVIVRLLEHEHQKSGDAELQLATVKRTLSQLTGRSTVGILTTTGRVFAYRFGSPLVVGQSQTGGLFLSSDVLSLADVASKYYSVKNGEVIVIEGYQAWVSRLEDDSQSLGELITLSAIDVSSLKIDKAGFDHFMLKEIHEQPEAYTHMFVQQQAAVMNMVDAIKSAHQVYTVGAGSASFAAGQLAVYLRHQGVNVIELKAYEAKSYHSLVTDKDLCIAMSQSGETADTNEVIEVFKEQGVKIGSLVNMSGSTLTALSDLPCMLQVGPEVGVASTKALTGQLLWSQVLAQLVGGAEWGDVLAEVNRYAQQLAEWLNHATDQQDLQQVASRLSSHQHVFVLGRGQLYYPALEFALKLKEISYIHAEGFSGGELKHGVIALIEKGTPVVCLIASDEDQADMISAAAEVKARGAHVIGVAAAANELFDTWIPVPDSHLFAAISAIIPAQFLTYYMALTKGLDPDKPRNLAKSVTVK